MHKLILIFLLVSLYTLNSFSRDTCKTVFEGRQNLNARIEEALNSRIEGYRLEGEVADRIRPYIVSFQREVIIPSGRTIGEIDVETNNFMIEIKSGHPKYIKEEQILRLAHDHTMNPNDKPVIIYSPRRWSRERTRNFENLGAIIIHDLDTLEEFLHDNDFRGIYNWLDKEAS